MCGTLLTRTPCAEAGATPTERRVTLLSWGIEIYGNKLGALQSSNRRDHVHAQNVITSVHPRVESTHALSTN
eukprot:2067076-Prymnesium_polylepis.1